eukprot:1084311-Rhodomonas_salina.1
MNLHALEIRVKAPPRHLPRLHHRNPVHPTGPLSHASRSPSLCLTLPQLFNGRCSPCLGESLESRALAWAAPASPPAPRSAPSGAAQGQSGLWSAERAR